MSQCMNTPQHWLIELYRFFAPKSEAVRISPDHLPGLRAPKPMPWTPPLQGITTEMPSDIDGMYRRFRASEALARTATQPRQRGVGF